MQLVLHEAAAAAPTDSSVGAAGNASSAGQLQSSAAGVGGAVDAGDDGPEPLESELAVAAAKRWYDEKGPFTGRFVLALPVLGAFRNSPTEYSLRYKVHPDTGDVVRAIVGSGISSRRSHSAPRNVAVLRALRVHLDGRRCRRGQLAGHRDGRGPRLRATGLRAAASRAALDGAGAKLRYQARARRVQPPRLHEQLLGLQAARGARHGPRRHAP